MAQHLDRQQLRKQWEDALVEDGATNDLTSMAAAQEKQVVRARLAARQEGVFAGLAVFDVLKEAYPGQLTVTLNVADGDRLEPGAEIATLAGPMRLLLGIERTLLNFLQRLCGVATMTIDTSMRSPEPASPFTTPARQSPAGGNWTSTPYAPVAGAITAWVCTTRSW